MSFSGASHPQTSIYSQDDLPKNVVRTLNQGSNVMSLDFHPIQQTILLGLFLFQLLVSLKCLLCYCVFSPGKFFNAFFLYFSIYVVGTNVGDIGIWEVGSRERIAHKTFKVWEISSCSLPLQVSYFYLNFNINLLW